MKEPHASIETTGIHNADYRRRALSQSLSWAMGHPYHEQKNGECCPDFSCCHPDMFTADQSKRWESHKRLVASYEGYADGNR